MVNGRPLSEALTTLRQYKATPKSKDMGKKSFDYYAIEDFVQAFDQCIGIANYTVEYSDFQYIRNLGNQDLFNVRCRITILDDDGKPLIFKEGYGSQELLYSETNAGRNVNFSGDPHSATTAAFKNAAKFFGCFGFYTKDKPKEGDKNTSKKNDTMVYNFYTNGAFFEAGTDKNSVVWKIEAHRDARNSDIICEIIFYPNQYKKDNEKFNRLFDTVKKKTTLLKLSVKECAERDGKKQYVFKNFE